MLPHIKTKLQEATEGFEVWIEENESHAELVGTELLTTAKDSLVKAQEFLEKLEQFEDDGVAVCVQDGQEDSNAGKEDDMMEPADSSSEEGKN